MFFTPVCFPFPAIPPLSALDLPPLGPRGRLAPPPRPADPPECIWPQRPRAMGCYGNRCLGGWTPPPSDTHTLVETQPELAGSIVSSGCSDGSFPGSSDGSFPGSSLVPSLVPLMVPSLVPLDGSFPGSSDGSFPGSSDGSFPGYSLVPWLWFL